MLVIILFSTLFGIPKVYSCALMNLVPQASYAAPAFPLAQARWGSTLLRGACEAGPLLWRLQGKAAAKDACQSVPRPVSCRCRTHWICWSAPSFEVPSKSGKLTSRSSVNILVKSSSIASLWHSGKSFRGQARGGFKWQVLYHGKMCPLP